MDSNRWKCLYTLLVTYIIWNIHKLWGMFVVLHWTTASALCEWRAFWSTGKTTRRPWWFASAWPGTRRSRREDWWEWRRSWVTSHALVTSQDWLAARDRYVCAFSCSLLVCRYIISNQGINHPCLLSIVGYGKTTRQKEETDEEEDKKKGYVLSFCQFQTWAT